jgi:glycosyltransferase involved in cell wall biosynthesis
MYNGIDTELFNGKGRESRKSFRERLTIAKDSPVVGIVANLRPVKGIDVFLRAARLVARQIPEARFIVAGDGTEREKLSGLVRELDLSQAVTFLGKVNDIASLLQAIDVGVLASHSEGFSNAIVEYMISGLPVVCTDAGGNREAVTDGENGFIVPVGNCDVMANRIIRIIQDIDLAKEMGRKNRIKAKALFSNHALLSSFENFIQEADTL